MRIDLEEWKRKDASGDKPLEVGRRLDTTPPGVPVIQPESGVGSDEDDARNRVEDEMKRLEAKRKKGTSEGINSKKRKFEKLSGWGEALEDPNPGLHIDIFNQEVVQQMDTEAPRNTSRSQSERLKRQVSHWK